MDIQMQQPTPEQTNLTPNDLIGLPTVFSLWLKELFFSSDLTMTEFAKLLRTDRWTLQRIIDGEGFHISTMVKILTAATQHKLVNASIPLQLKAQHVPIQQEESSSSS